MPDAGFEVFHLPEALDVVARHADADLELLAGFEGERPVALLPVFVQRRPVGAAITSPPPGMGIPRLGPILMPPTPDPRERERVNREFTRAVLQQLGPGRRHDSRSAGAETGTGQILDRLDVDAPLTLFRMECNPNYRDPRPYSWKDLDVEPGFTYLLDLRNRTAEDVLASFSRSLRREIRDGEDLDLTVETEGLAGAREVFRATASRFAEQDEVFGPSWSYVRDLFEALDEKARAYVARDADGEYLSGVTVLYSNDRAYFWQGGAKTIHEGTAINSLIHWRLIEDLFEDSPVESITHYDLMGANTERLSQYKAKFGGDLVPYYVVESSGAAMSVAKQAYRLVK